MTKKKQPTDNADKFFKTRPLDDNGKPKAGYKQCVKCKGWNKGPTTPKCYGCGEAFPPPKGKGKTTTTTHKQDFADLLTPLDKVKAFIDKSGGYDQALQSIDQWEELLDSCGSPADLRLAIETLKNWK